MSIQTRLERGCSKRRNIFAIAAVVFLVSFTFVSVIRESREIQKVKDTTHELVIRKNFTKGVRSHTAMPLLSSPDDTTIVTVQVPINIVQNVSMNLQIDDYITHTQNLASEVEQITHHPTEKKIIVHLFPSSNKRQRNCKNPRIFGRLSGTAVTLIKWETKQATIPTTNFTSPTFMEVTQIIGHYNVPVKGKYFIEIIGLFCNDLQWNQNYKEVCLEDPTTHRITNDDAFIDVTETEAEGLSSSASHSSTLGFWKMQMPSPDQNEYTSISKLLTRYQPQGCRSQEEQMDDRCQIPMSRQQFDPYIFEFSTHTNRTIVNGKDLNEKIRDKKSKKILLCFVGLSHAREMAREVGLILQEWNISSSLNVMNIDANFPRLVNPQIMLARGCNSTVIAAGQWSAGRKPSGGKYRGLPPTLFPEYQLEVKEMINRLQQSDLKNFHLRDIHYNALGDVKTTCPPQDWRSPPVVEGYNEIISQLCSSMNVSYIDTSSIVGPLWDISEDFCHYKNDKVARAEALYMLSRILKDILD